MFRNVVRAVTTVAALGLTATLAACDSGSVSFNGEKGVPLDKLDQSGPAPTAIALLGPDNVRVVRGDSLAISVEGEGADRLRFALGKGQLGIAREGWKIGQEARPATITVTLPMLKDLVLAGSGEIIADELRGEEAKIVIAGTGLVEARAIDAGKLGVDVVGSGTLRAAGKARTLDMTVAGSGDAEMDGLNVDEAKVDVAGSGRSRFASNGTVKANIMGSGEVRVFGRATCKISAMGSGKLICENGVADEASATPATGK
ncbi:MULTISPECIES: head GIN domain-containing protein [Novosphingobium]|uniref:head GIN domain-containing protein n=1 Tax=Novosphingobium TaxID=165696 RepID=UPI000D6E3110|nr:MULTISPECIES: head GIN domain-containing protein [Novosphingobium]